MNYAALLKGKVKIIALPEVLRQGESRRGAFKMKAPA
jgi:hypothetical protein